MSAVDAPPRVWVGCLGCYNAGNLNGEWFAAVEAPQDMQSFNVLRDGGAPLVDNDVPHYAEGHDELWVFDHENFHGLLTGECSPVEAAEKAQLLVDADEPEPLALYVRDGYSADDFADAWCGWHESEADYAQQLAEDCDMLTVPADDVMRMTRGTGRDLSSEWPFSCIDWSHAWRELRLGGDNWSEYVSGKGYAIFRSV